MPWALLSCLFSKYRLALVHWLWSLASFEPVDLNQSWRCPWICIEQVLLTCLYPALVGSYRRTSQLCRQPDRGTLSRLDTVSGKPLTQHWIASLQLRWNLAPSDRDCTLTWPVSTQLLSLTFGRFFPLIWKSAKSEIGRFQSVCLWLAGTGRCCRFNFAVQ